jgi:outer membrane protein OmpA-like peptidoglycan-associated protein
VKYVKNLMLFILLGSSLFLISPAGGEEVIKAQYNEQIGIFASHTNVGHLNSLVIFLADQLERNINKKYLSTPAIVTSFVCLSDLKRTSSLGRLISENLMHELQVRRWRIFDVRLVKDIIMTDAGEFSLSRNIKQIRSQYAVSSIITGTYTVAGSDIIVNARVLDIDSGTVVSSSQSTLPLNDLTTELLDSDMVLKSVKEEPAIVLPSEPKAEEKVIVVALEDIHFDFDKSTLTKEAQTILKKNLKILQENPKAKVRIAGYTSASGTEEYNQKLSERRANAVKDYLVAEGIVTPDRLSEIGYGKTKPVMYEAAPKDLYSTAAKANMRVLFEIMVK